VALRAHRPPDDRRDPAHDRGVALAQPGPHERAQRGTAPHGRAGARNLPRSLVRHRAHARGQRLREYESVGFGTFILSGYPLIEEAYRFADLVLPLLRRPVVAGPAAVFAANEFAAIR
jgi:hypothetical protein